MSMTPSSPSMPGPSSSFGTPMASSIRSSLPMDSSTSFGVVSLAGWRFFAGAFPLAGALGFFAVLMRSTFAARGPAA